MAGSRLYGDLCEKLEALGEEALKGFEVTQVKEKFGGLRFYYKRR
jgi:hypothetical protein